MTPASAAQVWLFDVDGTLTAPGQPINPDFAQWLTWFARRHDVRIVSAGSRDRILRQLGRTLVDALKVSYLRFGASVWRTDVEVERLGYEVPAGLETFAKAQARELGLPVTYRTAVLNQGGESAVVFFDQRSGRRAGDAFESWDAQFGLRQALAERIELAYATCRALVEPGTSVAVLPRAFDKSRVAGLVRQPVQFFANETHAGGSDHDLSRALVSRGDASVVRTVRGWKQTWSWLKRVSPSPSLGQLPSPTSTEHIDL